MNTPHKRSPLFNISLKWIVTVPFVIQIVSAVSIISYLSYQSGHKTVEAVAESVAEETGKQVYQELEHYLRGAHSVNRRHITDLKAGVISLKNLDRLHRYLVLQHQQNPYLTSFLFGSPKGDFRASHRIQSDDIGQNTNLSAEELPYEISMSSSNNPSIVKVYSTNEWGDFDRYLDTITNADVRELPWYRLAEKTKKAGWSQPFQVDSSNLLTLSAYEPFYDKAQNLLGVFAVNIDLNQLNKFLSNLKIGRTGKAFIIEHNGLLIANSTQNKSYITLGKANSKIKKEKTNFRRLSAEEIAEPDIQNAHSYLKNKFNDLGSITEPYLSSFQVNEEHYFISVNPYTDPYGLGWLIVIVVPESDFSADLHENIRYTLLLCALTLFTAIGIGLYTSRRITRSLSRLTDATHLFSENHIDQPLVDSPITEVQLLTTTLRQMMLELQTADRLRQQYSEDLEKQVAEKTIALTEAQRIARVGSWEIDATTRAITWSEELFRIFKLEPTAHIPNYPHILDRVLPSDRSKLRQAVDQALADGTPYTVEYGNILKDKSICYVISRGEAVFNKQGKVAKLRGSAQDISDRKQLEIALQLSETKLNDILNSATASIARLIVKPDRSWTIDYMSNGSEVLTGYPTSELKADPQLWVSLIYPEDWQAIEEQVYEDIFAEKSGIYTYRMRHRNGSTIWVSQNTHSRWDRQQKSWSVTIICADITERQIIRESLIKSQNTLHNISIASPGCIYIYVMQSDGTTYFEYISEAVTEIHELSAEQVMQDANLIIQQFHPEDIELYAQAVKRGIETMSIIQLEWRIIVPSGNIRWIQANARPERRDNGDIAWYGIVFDISDRKQTELALQQSDNKLLKLTENIPGMIYQYVVYADGHDEFTYVSQMCRDIYEVEPAIAMQDSSTLWSMVHPDDVVQLQKDIEVSIQNLSSFRSEHQIILPSGNRKWVQVFARPEEDNGSIVWDGVIVDITDRKLSEKLLLKSEAALLEAQRIAHIGSWEFDIQTQKITWSKELFHMFGLDPNQPEPNYSDYLLLIHPEDRNRLQDLVNRAVSEGLPYKIDYRAILPNGAIRYHEGLAEVDQNDRGEVTRLFGTNLDITDRKQAEIALIEKETQLRELANTSPSVIYTVIEEFEGPTKFEYLSPVFESIHEIKLEEAYADASLVFQQIHPDDIQDYLEATAKSVQTMQPFNHEWRICTASGKTKWLRASSAPTRRPNGDLVWHGVVSDISDRKQIEIDLANAKEAAEAATRAKSSFLANMSHEIRTPMNGVIGMTQLLETTDLTEEQEDFVQTIRQSGEALLTVINDILDLSKIESGMLELESVDFSLQEVVESVYKLLENQAISKELKFDYQIAPHLPQVIMGDQNRLRQILLNLVGNAIKFTHQGQVNVSVNGKLLTEPSREQIYQKISKSNPDLNLHELLEQKTLYQLEFAISDTGIGIRGDRIGKLFQPFTQVDTSTSRQYGGTGLGLAISKRLVEMMDGTIWVESYGKIGGNPPLDWHSHFNGEGSIFHFYISVLTSKAIATPSKITTKVRQENRVLATQYPLKILLVEDNLVNQRVAKLMLNRLGYEIDIANSGREAIQAVKLKHYDLLLMDVQMPEMDGLTATKIIRSMHESSINQVKIFAMTADAMPEDRQNCLDAGMDGYISKPITIPKITQIVSSV